MKNTKNDEYTALPTEADEQTALFRYISCELARYPMLNAIAHIPNGGYRRKSEAARMKAQGVRRGYPDILLDYPSCGKHGLRIELKRERNYRIDREQKRWIYQLNVNGYAAVFCFGWWHAWKTIESYIRGDGVAIDDEISKSLKIATGGQISKIGE